MRAAFLVGLLGISGCNQIFGLKPTNEQDAGPPFEAGKPGIDAPDFRAIRITKLIVDVTGVGSANQTVIDADPALDTDPHVQVGLLDQPLIDAPYVNGVVQIPVTLPGNDWRLVATLDGLRHEYQWKVIGAHITSRVSTGHPSPLAIPPNSSYALNLPTPPYKNFIFSTSGVWTETHTLSGGQGSPFTFSPAANNASEPAVGPVGVGQSSQGDWQLFVDQGSGVDCRPSLGTGFQSADLVANTATTTTPMWNAATSTWPDPDIKALPSNRFAAGLGSRFTGSSTYKLTEFGYVIRNGVPEFSRTKLANDLDHIGTRRAVMVNLMDCRSEAPMNMPPYVDVPAFNDHGAGERGMVKAVYLETSSIRSVSDTSTSVISSLQAISLTNTVALTAPIPTAIAFDGFSLEDKSSTAGDAPDFKYTIPLAPPRQVILNWQYEAGIADVKPTPDDVTVVLYNVVSSLEKIPVRVYHVTSPQVVIDSSVFDKSVYPTRKFIFEVIARTGAPGAATGDYTKLSYPMASASIYTYGFRVTP